MQNAHSPSRKLHEAIHAVITKHPHIPARQVKAHVKSILDRFSMSEVTVHSFISEQKQAGLLQAAKLPTGGPSVYSVVKKFDYQVLRDLSKYYRDNGTTEGFLAKQHNAALEEQLERLIAKYGVEKFFSAIPGALRPTGN